MRRGTKRKRRGSATPSAPELKPKTVDAAKTRIGRLTQVSGTTALNLLSFKASQPEVEDCG